MAHLPVEIFEHIARDLPLASAVSFALTTRLLFAILSKQYLPLLRRDVLSTWDLLQQLERDMPDVVSCRACLSLHAISNARRYSYTGCAWRRFPTPCQVDDNNRYVGLGINGWFSSTVMQMALKRARQGSPDTRNLMRLLGTNWHLVDRKPYDHWRGSQLRIVDDRALLWNYHLVRIPAREASHPRWFRVWVCPHLRVSNESDAARDIANDAPDANPSEQNLAWSRCKHCLTEFHGSCTTCRDESVDLWIHIWKDLGTGRDDAAWQCQLFGPEYHFSPSLPAHDLDDAPSIDARRPVAVTHPPHIGDISRAFAMGSSSISSHPGAAFPPSGTSCAPLRCRPPEMPAARVPPIVLRVTNA